MSDSKMISRSPVVKDLVLIGGGHTHVEVLRSFGMRPVPGVRITLVSRDIHTPYSGMLPGYVSGFYNYDDCHIDLGRVTTFAKARFIHEEAVGIDIQSRRILFQNRPSIPYDLLSINVGITPAASLVPGAKEHTTPVKPIDKLVNSIENLISKFRNKEKQQVQNGGIMKVSVVGGGAGGVEIAFSLQYRLEQERQALGLPESMKAQITLICSSVLLSSSTSQAQTIFRRLASERDSCMQIVEGDRVVQVLPDRSLVLASGRVLPSQDEVLWCTQAGAAPWLAGTGLPTDAMGFLAVDEYLRSDGGPAEVFAAGDVASCTPYPRPKAGVYAVRQGPPLAYNLRASLTGEPLRPFIPQTTNLSLLTTGERYCVGTKGWLTLEGKWLWSYKDYIDRTFMHKYGEGLIDMQDKMMKAAERHSSASSEPPSAYQAAGVEALTLFAESKMRCGGCGSKVGSDVLSRVLSRLRQEGLMSGSSNDRQSLPGDSGNRDDSAIVIGLDDPDDAALVRPPPPGSLLIHTVDFFRTFCSDPFIFGKIAANHALGDCYAMGGQPSTALAMTVVPLAAEGKMEEELFQMMAGASQIISEAGCQIVGGHTVEGEEASLGFTINGVVQETDVMRKSGLRSDQALVLTKALGTGTIMAAAMKGRAKGRWVVGALSSMQQSSKAAAHILQLHGSSSCTDVTGFGLVGHLAEMVKASQVRVEIDMAKIPVLQGAYECLKAGQLSSMHKNNATAVSVVSNFESELRFDERWPILVDPQTAGGMLAGVPLDQADICVESLRAAGYADAVVIGFVTSHDEDYGSQEHSQIQHETSNRGRRKSVENAITVKTTCV